MLKYLQSILIYLKSNYKSLNYLQHSNVLTLNIQTSKNTGNNPRAYKHPQTC